MGSVEFHVYYGPENYLVIEGQTRYICSLLFIKTTTCGCLSIIS